MEPQALRKTFTYKLKPTPERERERERVLWLCRGLDNTALEQRKTAYERRGASRSRDGQEAELKDLRAALPGYAAMHRHVSQDVLARLDNAFQAFFRRIRAGRTPGYPRFHGRDRYRSFTDKGCGNGARLDDGFLVLSKLGRIALRWSRPLQGAPASGRAHDRHDQPGSRRLLRRLLLRRCAPATLAADRP